MYINTFQCRRGHGRDAPADLAIMETIPRILHWENCPPAATRRFFGSLFLTADHRQRMKKLEARLGCRRGRDTPAYFAVMYLLTSNEDLYHHAANCFCRYGIEFAYATLRGMSPHDYTLFSAAKDIYTDTPGMALADLANSVVVDPLAFSLISNALLIARYGQSVLDIRERGSSA